MEQEKKEIISGIVEGIVYQSDSTGFTIMDLDYKNELLTVVATAPTVAQGEEVEAIGHFVNHPTYGRQFKAETITPKMPATAGAILKYLSSGAIKGIGPATARRLVDAFGSDTLRTMEEDWQQLSKIRGISKAKAEEIHNEYKRIFGIRTILIRMGQYGLTPSEAVNVYKAFGEAATELVTQNPYLLCSSQIGIEFERADAIAVQLGLDMLGENRIRAVIIHILQHNTLNGHTCLPRQRLIEVCRKYIDQPFAETDAFLTQMAEDKYVIIDYIKGTPMVFLPHLYESEYFIADRLRMLNASLPDNKKDWDAAITKQEKKLNIEYAPEQRAAIAQAARRGLTILTGGPGTGKTTAINGMIELLESEKKTVQLAAPTGRAAKRMSELCHREAKTIHRLLEAGYSPDGQLVFSKTEDDLLDCDALILDEVSMVDVALFANLLRALRFSCKLVLVGDYNQLPSVGAGNLLKDLIDSNCFSVVTLSHIFRQAAMSQIVTGAHEILSGLVPAPAGRDSDYFMLPCKNKIAGAKLIGDLVTKRLPQAYQTNSDKIQVLSPGRRGRVGSEQLNVYLRSLLNPASKEKAEIQFMGITFREEDKVMQIKNNYDIVWRQGVTKGSGIFNGDMGTIQKIDKKNGLVTIDFEGRVAMYTTDMLLQLEHAYAITVHKSQGSEFDIVVLSLLEPNPKLYYRNLLYTAVTRAKKLLVIVGDPHGVQMMVDNNKKNLRYTGLYSMLAGEGEENED